MSSFIKNLFGNSAVKQVVSSDASRNVAKERLSVILAAQRGSDILEGVDREQLQRDVMEVVQKHLRQAKTRSTMERHTMRGGNMLMTSRVAIARTRLLTGGQTGRRSEVCQTMSSASGRRARR